MKLLLIVFSLLLAIPARPQTLRQAGEIATVMDNRKNGWLDSLMERVGGKRIVAIGEDTHGTAEFYELRNLITRRLVTEKGFNMLILENPHEDMMALQLGLQKENLDSLMRRHLFSIYQTSQMKAFLQWFKNHSRKRKQLRLAGCDDSYREILSQELIRLAAAHHNEQLSAWSYDFFLRQSRNAEEYYAQLSVAPPVPLPNEMRYGCDTYRLLQRMDSLVGAEKIYDPALKELIFHAQTAYVFYDRFARKLPVSRDEIMGERISYYAADPGAKIIVWAHNGHIANYAWLNNELGLMGATVRKHYPGEYLSIGLSSAAGSYSYIKNRFINNDHDFSDSLFTATLQPAKTGSWNELLSGYNAGRFFLDFSRLDTANRSEWVKPKALKIMGYGKESGTQKEYYDISLPRLFDVMIFLQQTSATTGLFN